MKLASVPACAQRQARVCNREHKHADDHHDALEDDEQYLIISELALETFAQFSNAEGAAD